MLHIGIAPHGDLPHITNNVSEKLKKYIDKESTFYIRYKSIITYLIALLNNYNEESDDFRAELCNATFAVSDMLDDVYSRGIKKEYDKDEFLEIIHKYMDKFKSPEAIDYINIINDTIKNNSIDFSNTKYSFYNGVKVLNKKKIAPQEATQSIIQMLYARDYFNINSILILRKYLLNTQITQTMLDMGNLRRNPGNDFFGLLFSDYGLIDNIFDLYGKLRSNSEFLSIEIILEDDNKLLKENFDYICMIIYARYVISIILFIIEFDINGNFVKERIDLVLLKLYRTFSIIILNSVFRSLSMLEFILFSDLEILDDVCIHAHLFSSQDKLNEASNLSSAIAANIGHKKHDDIINMIMQIVNKRLDKGYKDSHAKMLKDFKNSPEFSKYFNKAEKENRGFERALRRELIKTYQLRGLPVIGINGAGIPRTQKKN